MVVVEDDMLVSPDFFLLFRDTAPLLDADPTVFCVSSWHDNGRRGLVYDPHRLFRTSYFPGLGWMLKRSLWDELHSVFPLDQWDHFMRLDSVHRGRSCVVPEISRNRNIGEQGTNMGGSFFARFLEPIAYQQTPVRSFNRPGASQPLEHLRQPHFDSALRAALQAAEVLGDCTDAAVRQRLAAVRQSPAPVEEQRAPRRSLVTYRREDYHFLADLLSLLPVPRSTHGGISILRVAPEPRGVDAPQLGDGVGGEGGADGDASHWLYFVDVRRVNFSLHLPSWLEPASPHQRLVLASAPRAAGGDEPRIRVVRLRVRPPAAARPPLLGRPLPPPQPVLGAAEALPLRARLRGRRAGAGRAQLRGRGREAGLLPPVPHHRRHARLRRVALERTAPLPVRAREGHRGRVGSARRRAQPQRIQRHRHR